MLLPAPRRLLKCQMMIITHVRYGYRTVGWTIRTFYCKLSSHLHTSIYFEGFYSLVLGYHGCSYYKMGLKLNVNSRVSAENHSSIPWSIQVCWCVLVELINNSLKSFWILFEQNLNCKWKLYGWILPDILVWKLKRIVIILLEYTLL